MNVPNIITALVTGDVAYDTLLFGSGRARRASGYADACSRRASWMVQLTPWSPSLNTNRASNLREKLSASVTSGGTDEVAGRMMLKSFGLDTERDLKFIALGPDRARLAALKEGLSGCSRDCPAR